MDIPSHLLPTKMDDAFYARTHHQLIVQPGVTPEHIADPDFWVHVCGPTAGRYRLKVFDLIDVIAADGTFDATLRVIAIDPRAMWAQVRILRLWRNKEGQKPNPVTQWPDKEGYVVEYDRQQRWRIIRGTELVARDFPDEASAVDALNNIKATKRKVA